MASNYLFSSAKVWLDPRLEKDKKIEVKRSDGSKHIMKVSHGDGNYLKEVCRNSKKVKCSNYDSMKIDDVIQFKDRDDSIYVQKFAIRNGVPDICDGLVEKIEVFRSYEVNTRKLEEPKKIARKVKKTKFLSGTKAEGRIVYLGKYDNRGHGKSYRFRVRITGKKMKYVLDVIEKVEDRIKG